MNSPAQVDPPCHGEDEFYVETGRQSQPE